MQVAQAESDLKISEAASRDYNTEAERLRGAMEKRDDKIAELERQLGKSEAENSNQAVVTDDLKYKLEDAQRHLDANAEEMATLKQMLEVPPPLNPTQAR